MLVVKIILGYNVSDGLRRKAADVTSYKTKQLTDRLKNIDKDVKAPDSLKDKIKEDIKKSK